MDSTQPVASRKVPLALLVENDADSHEMYAEYLRGAGIRTSHAEDGLTGFLLAATQLPDIITTDLNLPRMDGLELCQRLKDQPTTKHIPVIALTGSAAHNAIEALKAAGCVSVLIKPCLPETLVAEIRRVLALQEARPADELRHYCHDGWICEQHPDQPWPHGDCPGSRTLCLIFECPKRLALLDHSLNRQSGRPGSGST